MRNRYLLMIDLPLIAAAAFGAFALRFDWLFLAYRPEFWTFVAVALVIKPVVWYVFGMYSRVWRYASARDLLAVVLAASAASVVLAVVIGIGRAASLITDFSRPVLLLDWLLSLTLLGGARMSVRMIGEAQQTTHRLGAAGPAKKVVVIGAGEAGTMVVRELRRNPQLGLEPIGFLDDDPGKQRKWIGSVRVLGPISALTDIATGVDQAIIAMPAAGGSAVRRVAEICQRAGVESRTVPGVFELLGGHVAVSRLRQVEITDLLRREHRVAGEASNPAAYLQGARVVVTGAGGSIGHELCRQIVHARPALLVMLGHGENSIFEAATALRQDYPGANIQTVIADVRDARRIERVFASARPNVVFHAAAHKHVPLMEENPVEAISNNVLGTHIVAGAAARHGAERFVLISTDKAVAPSSVMGASKRVAELVVRHSAGRGQTAFMAVRFGNVLGSRGSVVPLFKAQIERGGPVTVTHPDMRRFFMTIPEAVHLVLRAGGLGRGGELFVLNMGDAVRISDLAADLIKLSGFSPAEIPIVFTALRPGEKLEEVLWEENATVEPTSDPDILRVTEPATESHPPLADVINQFTAAAEAGDVLAIQAALAVVIPTFVPGFAGDRLLVSPGGPLPQHPA